MEEKQGVRSSVVVMRKGRATRLDSRKSYHGGRDVSLVVGIDSRSRGCWGCFASAGFACRTHQPQRPTIPAAGHPRLRIVLVITGQMTPRLGTVCYCSIAPIVLVVVRCYSKQIRIWVPDVHALAQRTEGFFDCSIHQTLPLSRKKRPFVGLCSTEGISVIYFHCSHPRTNSVKDHHTTPRGRCHV